MRPGPRLVRAKIVAAAPTGAFARDEEIALAEILSVEAPASAGAPPGADLVGRCLPVLLDRARTFGEWSTLEIAILARALRRSVLRPDVVVELELADGCLWLTSGPRIETTRDEPGIAAEGFPYLSTLLTHVLKHVAGFGEPPEDRLAARVAFRALGVAPGGDAWIERIAEGGCPLQRAFEHAPMPADLPPPCSACSVSRRMECFGIALEPAQAYTRLALRELAASAEPPTARHLHFEAVDEAPRSRSVVAALSDRDVEVVAKGAVGEGERKRITTCFLGRADGERPAETRARRRLCHLRGFGTSKRAITICTEGGWRREG